MSYIKTLSPAAFKNMNAIIDAAPNMGVTNEMSIAAVLAVVSKESGFMPQTEQGYAGTSIARLRKIFRGALKDTKDSDLERIKQKDEAFFNLVYGGRFGNGRFEGYKYRGRGYNQLTFKNNYARMAAITGDDLVNDPDKANEPLVAGRILFAYLMRRFAMAKPIVQARYGAGSINDFSNLIVAANAIYNANAGFDKDTRNTQNDGYALTMGRVTEFYQYVKDYGR